MSFNGEKNYHDCLSGEEERFGFRFQITSMLLAVGGRERSGEGREEKEVLIEQGPGGVGWLGEGTEEESVLTSFPREGTEEKVGS